MIDENEIRKLAIDIDPDSTITITLADDSTMECAILARLGVKEKHYIVLLPLSEKDDEASIFLYRYNQLTDEDIQLIDIETDEEHNEAVAAFNQYLASKEINQ